MRRVGTLTSACTMLALGLLLLADLIWNRQFFAEGLNFWPLIVVGLGLELLVSFLAIKRKHLPERIRLDGRSVGLLFLVGVFSVNFYLSSVRAAQGAEEVPPQQPIFSVTNKDVALPQQVATMRQTVKQLVVQNPYGKIEVVGTSDPDLTVQAVAHVSMIGDETPLIEAGRFTPFVEFGEAVKVYVPDQHLSDPKAPLRSSVDVKISVPQHLLLALRGERGDIRLSSYEGSATIWEKAGNVTVENLKGDLTVDNLGGSLSVKQVDGKATLSNQQGSLSAQDVKGSVIIKSDTGNATVKNVGGKLDLTASLGKVDIEGVAGDLLVNSKSGLLKVKNAQAALYTMVRDGDIALSGAVKGPWTVTTSNGRVDIDIPKESQIRFLGETSKGVIKGPTKQSPSTGTKQGAFLTDQMGSGTYPLTVRSDNGGIFVETN